MMKKLSLIILLTASLLTSFEAFAKKNIVILATGGTIAGVGDSANGSKYSAGKVTIEELIKATPSLSELANLKGEQLMQISSEHMNDATWLTIAKRVRELVRSRKVDGVVITHGTDTLEETAYFLNLTIQTKKPIVVVGSMRPSTSISADGPLNLYNAVATAANSKSKNKGVMVVFNDNIFDARSVTKGHTSNVAAFNSPNFGPIGNVHYGKVKFYYNPLRTHTNHSAFDIKNLKSLPKVDILYGYAGLNSNLVDQLIEDDTKGIVFAGVGDGNIYKNAFEKLVAARKSGLILVRSSRVGAGYVVPNAEINDDENGFVTADNLSPQKARILLKLSLTETENPKKLQKIFWAY